MSSSLSFPESYSHLLSRRGITWVDGIVAAIAVLGAFAWLGANSKGLVIGTEKIVVNQGRRVIYTGPLDVAHPRYIFISTTVSMGKSILDVDP